MTESDNTTPHQASDYDRKIRTTIPFYEAIQREAIDLVRTTAPQVDTWLDAGCGTGYLVELALPLFLRTRFVLADSSQAMLRQAAKRLKHASPQRVDILPPIRNEELSLRQWSVTPQVVTSILCHHYLQAEQREAAVRAVHHLLDQDGIFITFENIDPGSPSVAQTALERWKHYQIRQGRPPSEAEEHATRFNTAYFPITIGEHVDLLKQIGFRVVALFWLSHMQAGFYAIK